MGADRSSEPLHLTTSDEVPVRELVRYALAAGPRSLQIARQHRQLHGFVPWLLIPLTVAIAWLLRWPWVLPAGVMVTALATCLPTLLPRLLARAGTRGRVLLYERSDQALASVTLQVRRRGVLSQGTRYIKLWNLAAVPIAGQQQTVCRSGRVGWLVMQRAIALAHSAGLDLRLQATTPVLAKKLYEPLGFVYEHPKSPGPKPRMVLRVPRRGASGPGLAQLQTLANQAADHLQVPRPPVTIDMDGPNPNARAASSGRAEAYVQVTPALTTASPAVQQWFMAHEVGHLQLGVRRPLRTALTGLPALAGYFGAVLLLCAPLLLWMRPEVVLPVLVLLLLTVLRAWAVCAQAEEFAADRLAARVLAAQGQDPVAGTKAVLDQPWFGPRGRGFMLKLGTHPTAERRMAAVELAASTADSAAAVASRGR